MPSKTHWKPDRKDDRIRVYQETKIERQRSQRDPIASDRIIAKVPPTKMTNWAIVK